eukprot:COSAG06_NODE_10911_length_1597_cov_1.016689_4_plen_83_part_00
MNEAARITSVLILSIKIVGLDSSMIQILLHDSDIQHCLDAQCHSVFHKAFSFKRGSKLVASDPSGLKQATVGLTSRRSLRVY